MIAKRLLAVAAAVALIAGAWLVRTQVIEADSDDGPSSADVVVCATELQDVCRQAVTDARLDLNVVAESAGETLDELGDAAAVPGLWVTFDGYPEMLNALRGSVASISYTAFGLASSPLVAIVAADEAGDVTGACGNPVDLGCVGEQGALVPPVESGVGLISLAAMVQRETGGFFDPSDPDLAIWARNLTEQPSNGLTAIETYQVRPSVAPLAVGIEADVAPSRRAQLAVLYADPMVRVQAVLMQPNGVELPGGFLDALRREFASMGWDDPQSPIADAVPPPATVLGIREFWRER